MVTYSRHLQNIEPEIMQNVLTCMVTEFLLSNNQSMTY